MKRILICAAYFYPHAGGYEKNVGELARRLSDKGFDIDILTFNLNNTTSEERLGKITIYRLPCWKLLGGTYAIPIPSILGFRIIMKLLGKNYYIISTQTRFFITSLLGLGIAKIKRIPLIHTERGSKHSVVSSKWVDMFSKTYDHTLGTLIIKYGSF